jgi:hypothetical protein
MRYEKENKHIRSLRQLKKLKKHLNPRQTSFLKLKPTYNKNFRVCKVVGPTNNYSSIWF